MRRQSKCCGVQWIAANFIVDKTVCLAPTFAIFKNQVLSLLPQFDAPQPAIKTSLGVVLTSEVFFQLSFGIVRAIPLGSSSSLEDNFDTIEGFNPPDPQ